MKRTLVDYVIQYVVLPIILIGSDIVIGLLSHFGGKMGFQNIFSADSIMHYLTYHVDEILFVIVIAIIVCLIVEYIVRDIERKK